MYSSQSKFHFPTDIQLRDRPLAEAWLEIRWRLQPSGIPHLMKDAGFVFALGTFYNSIKDRFGYREDLETSQAPLDILPYVIRHRFRSEEGTWPLLQIGPGVATVNFFTPYTWSQFKDTALYLREKLTEAYKPNVLEPQSLGLRYRNFLPFDFQKGNLLDFLRDNLNTDFQVPAYIPGGVASKTLPTSANITLTFDLIEPKGTGTLLFATATRNPESVGSEAGLGIIWQSEVISADNDAPNINHLKDFSVWLDSAHAVAHEWFFALIDGKLFRTYRSGGE